MSKDRHNRKLPRGGLEDLRRKAVRRVLTGESPEWVARSMGFHRSRIYAWLKVYRQQGEAGLKARPVVGRPAKLDVAARHRLITLISNKTPQQLGIAEPLWTPVSIATLIKQHFSIDLGKAAVNRLLTNLGLNTQRPYEYLTKQGSAEILQWLENDYPRLQQRVTRNKEAIFFLLKANSTETSVYFLSATSPQGKRYFMCYKKSLEADAGKDFLLRLLDIVGKSISLVVDFFALRETFQHHSIRDALGSQKEKLTLIALPAHEQGKEPTSSEEQQRLPGYSDIDQWILLLNQSLLDPQYPLSTFLSTVGHFLGGLAVIAPDLNTISAPIRFSLEGSDLNTVIALNKNIARTWPSNPFLTALKKPGDLFTLDELIHPREWNKNDYCRFYQTINIAHVIGLCFAGPDGTRGGLFITRRLGESPFDAQSRRFLTALRPHLETAMALTIRLWHSTYTARALEETTDHLDIAAIILDGNGRIIKNNHTAQEMMDQKQQLTQHNQQLDFLLPGHQTKFERAVAKAIAWRQAPVGNKPVEAMRFAYPSVDAIGVLVQAITPPTLLIPHATAVSPHVIVYINEPSRPKPHPQRQLIAHLFNLSAREAYLTSLLTSGHTVEEAAQVMNITHTTARTYLQHVYEKIGVNRRQDLVQRVMKSVALLA